MKSKKLIIAIAVIIVAIAAAIAGYFLVYNSPERQLDRYLDLGAKYIEEGDYDKALEAYNMALEIDDKCTEAYIGLIHVYEETGDYEMAMQVAEQGVAMAGSPELEAKLVEIKEVVANQSSSSSGNSSATTDVPADTQEENVVNLDEFVGTFSDGDNLITIEKNGNNYTMSVVILRLASFTEGTVTAAEKGVEFDSPDYDGVKFLYYKENDGTFTLRVLKSNFEYLKNGDVFSGFDVYDEAATGTSDFEDGLYISSLMTTDPGFSFPYVRGVEFVNGGFILDASLEYADVLNGEIISDIDHGQYFFAVDDNTEFVIGGGEDAPDHITYEEFQGYCDSLKDSGLSLQITIENGVAVLIGIWS